MAIKMSLLQVRRIKRIVHKVRRAKPVKSRADALWDSPLVLWEPLE
jgi:hypothetical protein